MIPAWNDVTGVFETFAATRNTTHRARKHRRPRSDLRKSTYAGLGLIGCASALTFFGIQLWHIATSFPLFK
ncbi:MAG TPA: hypothetical protein VLF59_05225 [Candidatus Saccharimonadales bacterium]|nr:hypothetical protein [Candidatus Saccharimonadales bacterium]